MQNALKVEHITQELDKMGILNVVSIPLVKKFSVADSDYTPAAEANTDIVLPAKCIVLDVFVDVTTADAAITLDVGTDGSGSDDPDGFLDGVSLATAGIVKGALADGGVTKGALLREDVTGATKYAPTPDVSSGGETVTYTILTGADTAEFDIYVVYIDLTNVATPTS